MPSPRCPAAILGRGARRSSRCRFGRAACDASRMPDLETATDRPGDPRAVDALALREWGGTRIYDVAGAFETSGLAGAVAIARRRLRRRGDLVARSRPCSGSSPSRARSRAGASAARCSPPPTPRRAPAGPRGSSSRPASAQPPRARPLPAQRLRLAALHLGAIDAFRRLKPQIPEIDPTGIPLRDMIELEKRLGAADGA